MAAKGVFSYSHRSFPFPLFLPNHSTHLALPSALILVRDRNPLQMQRKKNVGRVPSISPLLSISLIRLHIYVVTWKARLLRVLLRAIKDKNGTTLSCT